MRRMVALLITLTVLAGCHSTQRDPGAVVFLIESSLANLDPRIGTDAQSQRIDALLFDGLVDHDAKFQFTPALATSWEQPNPVTLVFHLRGGVRFHDGRSLTARDVVWTINSILTGAVISPKAAAYVSVESIEARDALTVVFHLKHADNFLLRNCSRGKRARILETSSGHGTVPVCASADRSGCRDRKQSTKLGRSAEVEARAFRSGARRDYGVA
jgi:peptide/nickel transport system substrate-binding protein